MQVFHGCKYTNLHNLVSGKSSYVSGLFVTDTCDRARLYANAQASEVVELGDGHKVRSAIVTMEASVKKWYERDNSTSLDVREAVVKEWSIEKVEIWASKSDHNVFVKVDGEYKRYLSYLQETFGEKLVITFVD